MSAQSSALAVKFYKKPMDMEFESQVQGRPIVKMFDFVKIETPGNMLNVIDTFANQDHKDRFPLEWAKFVNSQVAGQEGGDYMGTPLSDWPLLNAAQAIELKYFKFYTVENIAEASDAHIHQIGGLAGMAPHALRDKAKAFLSRAKESASDMAKVDEVAKRDQEIADLKADMKRMADQMAAASLQMQRETDPLPRRKPGPKPKQEGAET